MPPSAYHCCLDPSVVFCDVSPQRPCIRSLHFPNLHHNSAFYDTFCPSLLPRPFCCVLCCLSPNTLYKVFALPKPSPQLRLLCYLLSITAAETLLLSSVISLPPPSPTSLTIAPFAHHCCRDPSVSFHDVSPQPLTPTLPTMPPYDDNVTQIV